jgi:hypothetical protein
MFILSLSGPQDPLLPSCVDEETCESARMNYDVFITRLDIETAEERPKINDIV